MADLELLGVSKVFPSGTKAVDRLDLFVRDGELVVLVGPSGSGKTTILRLIAGLEQPSTGTIRIAGRDVTALAPRDRDLAMVFQQLGLYGHLSARENMAFGLRLRQQGVWSSGSTGERIGKREIDERVSQVASLLGITPLLDRKPAELSGGQQQRVALGRAIVRRPQAMLLDEPLASLDVPTRLSLRRELKRLHRELAMTMVYVTHDQAEALALGDRIAVIRDGRLEQLGTRREIYERPGNRFVAGFFGSQGMNFLPASQSSAGQARVLGVRPEDVCLVEPGSPTDDKKMDLGLATVVDVENLGENTFVRLKLEVDGSRETGDGKDAEWVCRAEPLAAVEVGERKQVLVDRRRLHWFAPDRGERVDGAAQGSERSR
jgi:ABC-type sugar transport system ATPase subunit